MLQRQIPTLEFLREKRTEILAICAKHGAKNVRIFGSTARGEADEQSDVDFLVDLESGRTLLDLGGLQYDLEHYLLIPVDVATESMLKDRIKVRVFREATQL
jgi:Predicted nucleotidyltransferases